MPLNDLSAVQDIADAYKIALKQEAVAIEKEGEGSAVGAGVIQALRGKALNHKFGKPIEAAPVYIKGDKLLRLDGSEVDFFTAVSAIGYADAIGIPKLIDESKFFPPGTEVKFEIGKPEGQEEVAAQRKLDLKQQGFSPAEIDAIMNVDLDKPINSGTINNSSGLIPVKLSEMAEAYLSFAQQEKKSEKSFRSKFNMFIEYVGDLQSTEITRVMITDYRNALCKFPKRANVKYPDLSFKEITEIEVAEVDRLAPATVNTYIERLSTLFNWAVDQSYMRENVTPSIKLKPRKNKEPEEKFFTTEELQKYFNESPRHKEGLRNKPEMFWLPLNRY